jgi:hypothetical protein
MELAHIVMGHHIDTRYAFNDRLMFPDQATFQKIDMYHSDHDNAEAAKRAMEYLGNSMYKDKLPSAGLYYAQLVDREKELKALNTPTLGDSLLQADGTPWMADLMRMSPRLNWDDLAQRPALPLGSWLKTDPWDDRVHQLSAKIYAYMNPRDKMPLEVTPIFYKLQRYDVSRLTQATSSPAAPATVAPAAQPAAAPPATAPSGTAAPAATPPAAEPTPGDAAQQPTGPPSQAQQ